MYRFAADKLLSIIQSIPQTVYLPVEKDGLVSFARYEEGVQVALDKCGTDKSAKDVFFPQWENLMQFRVEGKTISLTEEERCNEDFVLFGVRACDLRAIHVLDSVFLPDPPDTYYAARRAHLTTVAIACAEPADTCFCGVFGLDPAEPQADVTLWQIGDTFYAKAGTEKGEALIAAWGLEKAEEADVADEKAAIRKKLAEKPYANLSLAGFDSAHLNELFESPQWEKLSMACLGCGTCTFVCPTCQCYDIRDYDAGHGVERYRCWDSCMYSDFTMMAAETPRPTQKERYRQRFMHKLVYHPTNNNGDYGCVGCGRCLQKCPMNLNIAKVIKALGEGNK